MTANGTPPGIEHGIKLFETPTKELFDLARAHPDRLRFLIALGIEISRTTIGG